MVAKQEGIQRIQCSILQLPFGMTGMFWIFVVNCWAPHSLSSLFFFVTVQPRAKTTEKTAIYSLPCKKEELISPLISLRKFVIRNDCDIQNFVLWMHLFIQPCSQIFFHFVGCQITHFSEWPTGWTRRPHHANCTPSSWKGKRSKISPHECTMENEYAW